MDYLLSAIATALEARETLLVCLVLGSALVLRAAVGFGDGLIAVPLLAFFMELHEVVPIIILISSLMSIVSLWKDRQHVQLGSLKRTAVAAIVGIPTGVALLRFGEAEVMRGLLGILLIVLGAWQLGPFHKPVLRGEGWSYLFGFLAGCFGSAYALRGIVISVYGGLRGWGPAQFKSTIHGFYLLSGVAIPITYIGAGLVTEKVMGMVLVLLPIAIAATLLGQRLTGALDAHLFQRIIWGFLLLFGLVLAGEYVVNIGGSTGV